MVGCRKVKGINRFFDRMAGDMALVCPCGIFVNTTVMYTCESPTQVYLFLVMRANDIDRLLSTLATVGHVIYTLSFVTWRQREHTLLGG